MGNAAFNTWHRPGRSWLPGNGDESELSGEKWSYPVWTLREKIACPTKMAAGNFFSLLVGTYAEETGVSLWDI